MLDKLCKSILNWKQGITQAAAGDGLRHRPHRRSCSVYPTSTSSVAAWPPRHLPRIAKGDARSHPRRALPPRAPPRVCASHVHLIRRGDFGHVLCVRRAPFRRCPPQNGDEKLRPASPKAMHDLIRGGPCPLGLPRGCAHPTSTSSVAATSVMCCASDARLSGAALRKTETKNSAPHRTDAGRSFVTAAAPARRPFCGLSGCLFAGYPVRRPFRWLSGAAAFPLAFLCACGHRAAFLTRPSRSCPRATPRTGCAYGRSGGRTPSSPATTAGRTR